MTTTLHSHQDGATTAFVGAKGREHEDSSMAAMRQGLHCVLRFFKRTETAKF